MIYRAVSVDDARLFAEYYAANSAHLHEWEPRRAPEFYTETFWKQRLAQWKEQTIRGDTANFLGVTNDSSSVIAVCSLSNIVRGPFQACNVGYSVSRQAEGTGAMKSLLSFVIEFAFSELELNRVMANYMPRNKRSERLLASLGFREEGIAERYLLINGVWEDHVLTSLLNPKNC